LVGAGLEWIFVYGVALAGDVEYGFSCGLFLDGQHHEGVLVCGLDLYQFRDAAVQL